MNKLNTVILGAGGHTRSILNIIDRNFYNILGIYDNSYNSNDEAQILGVPLIGNLKDINDKDNIIISLGDNRKRKELFLRFKNRINLKNIIHKTAYIENSSFIGQSNQIFANSYINSNSVIGNNNILNSGCIIEHESKLGCHNHISVGAIICGRVIIGDECFIGAGSVVKDNVKICNNVTVGANSLVIKDITQPGVYIGNPVKRLR
jgi:UDP-N-acetylbacillosamine N-acetyltransferase